MRDFFGIKKVNETQYAMLIVIARKGLMTGFDIRSSLDIEVSYSHVLLQLRLLVADNLLAKNKFGRSVKYRLTGEVKRKLEVEQSRLIKFEGKRDGFI